MENLKRKWGMRGKKLKETLLSSPLQSKHSLTKERVDGTDLNSYRVLAHGVFYQNPQDKVS